MLYDGIWGNNSHLIRLTRESSEWRWCTIGISYGKKTEGRQPTVYMAALEAVRALPSKYHDREDYYQETFIDRLSFLPYTSVAHVAYDSWHFHRHEEWWRAALSRQEHPKWLDSLWRYKEEHTVILSPEMMIDFIQWAAELPDWYYELEDLAASTAVQFCAPWRTIGISGMGVSALHKLFDVLENEDAPPIDIKEEDEEDKETKAALAEYRLRISFYKKNPKSPRGPVMSSWTDDLKFNIRAIGEMSFKELELFQKTLLADDRKKLEHDLWVVDSWASAQIEDEYNDEEY